MPICPAALLLLSALRAQESPQYKVDVDLVTVGVTVRNATGTLVTGLSKDDFEILEDGAVQNIKFFARQSDMPLRLGLAVDVSGSQDKFNRQHRRDLESFLKAVLQPRDGAFLVCFGNRLRLVSDFSNSSREIIDALERFDDDKGHFPILGPEEHRVLGTALYDAIYYGVREKFQEVTAGRRAMVVFSDGEENSSGHDLLDAIEAAQRSDVLVYALRYTDHNGKRETVRNRYGSSALHHLAIHTGGSDFDAAKQGVRDSFRMIGEELRSLYEIGYVSSNPERDGQYRKVRVRLKQPGLTAQAKPGYYAR